jgi:hypothetical protein
LKFYSPELYVEAQSQDDDVLDRHEAEMERLGRRYKRYYRRIKAKLPLRLRQFHDEQCLHDADVFAPALLPMSAPWDGQQAIIVAQQINTLFAEYINTLAILQYTITSPPVVEVALDLPLCKRVQPIWLYDEVDVVEPGVFSHEILISDGRVVKLLFSDFNYYIAPLCLPGKTDAKKQQAASA